MVGWLANTSISVSDYSILPSIHQIIRFQQHSILITNTSHPIHTIITLLSSQHHSHPYHTHFYHVSEGEWSVQSNKHRHTCRFHSHHSLTAWWNKPFTLKHSTIYLILQQLPSQEYGFHSPHSSLLSNHIALFDLSYRLKWYDSLLKRGWDVLSLMEPFFRTRIDEVESSVVTLPLPITITLGQCVCMSWTEHLSDLWFSEWFEILWFSECEWIGKWDRGG